MSSSARVWWDNFKLTDPIQRKQATVFQLVLVVWIAIASVGVPLTFLQPMSQTPPPVPVGPIDPIIIASFFALAIGGLMFWVIPVVSLVLLRRGHFSRSVMTSVIGMMVIHSVGTYILGVTDASTLIVFQVPIALAGLLGGRRLLFGVTASSLLVVLITAALQSQTPPTAGIFGVLMSQMMGLPPPVPSGQVLGFFIAVTLLIAFLLDRFGFTLRDALTSALRREHELEEIRTSLEGTVLARTAELQFALEETQLRAAEQSRMFEEIEQQRLTIRDLSVPVIPVSARTLVIPLVGVMDSQRLRYVQEQSLRAIESASAHTLVLDVTGVPIVDSQVAEGLLVAVRSCRLLGANTILVGIRPEVAQAMVGVGIDLQEVRTFRDLQSALSHSA